MLENIAQNVILPYHQQFAQSARDLQNATLALQQTPTEQTLELAQTAWRNANHAWQHATLFQVGGLELMILHNQISKTPSNTGFIESFIAEADTIDAAFIESTGSTARGLPALEYLLFDPAGNDGVLAALRGDARRLAYVVALAENITQKADALVDFWSPDGGNQAGVFAAADDKGGKVSGSINLLTNEMIALSELAVRDYLAAPLGLLSGGEPDPTLVQAFRSQDSLAQIKSHVEALERTFTGADGLGFDDYLDFMRATYGYGLLSTHIEKQLADTLDALNAIELPLSEAVLETPELVQAAYDEARLLVIAFKVDMGGHLGVTVTFSDSDGD